MLTLNRNYQHKIASLLPHLNQVQTLFNKCKVQKTSTYRYFQVKKITLYKSSSLNFKNINASFKNNTGTTKRYISQVIKLLPINFIKINESLWIDSDFYNSYKNESEKWYECHLSENIESCKNIKKIISLCYVEPEETEQQVRYNSISDSSVSIICEQFNYVKQNTIAFGEFANCNTFIIDYNPHYGNTIVIASNWEDLIDNMTAEYLSLFIGGMHTDNLLNQIKLLRQNDNKYRDINNIKLILKENLC
jgi:hypothetical protein